MFKIVEEPGSSTFPPLASQPAISLYGYPIDTPKHPLLQPSQPDLKTPTGWSSMLIDGAQTPWFNNIHLITSGGNWPVLAFNATQPDPMAPPGEWPSCGFIVGTRHNEARWSMELGGTQRELGDSSGSDFTINRFDDVGAVLQPSPFAIKRSTGKVTLGSGLILGAPPNNTLEIDPGATPSDPVTISSSSDVGIKFLDPIIIDTTADPTDPPAELTIKANGTALLKFQTTAGDTSSIDLGPGGSLHIGRYASGVLVDYPLQTGPDGVILIDGRVWIRGSNTNSPFPAAPQPVLIEPPTTFGSGITPANVPTDTPVRLQSPDTHPTRLAIDAFGANAAINYRKANGTSVAPVALAGNEVIGAINYFGHDGTDFFAQASQNAVADGPWSGASRPSKIMWQVTPVGSITQLVEAMSLTSAGSLKIGTATNNALTITPGPTATDPILLNPSGTAGFAMNAPLSLPVGSAAATSLNFGQASAGFFGATNSISVATNSTTRLTISNTITSTIPIRTSDGTAIAPSFTFGSDALTGFYKSPAFTIGVTVAGVLRLSISSADVISTLPITVGTTGTNNTLKITPGAAISDPIVMAKSGSGGLTLPQLTGVTVGTTGNNRLTITPGATGTDPVVFSTSGAGFVLPTATIKDQVNIGDGTRNILTLNAGFASTDLITFLASGSGSFNFNNPIIVGVGTKNTLTITPGATASAAITLGPSGTGTVNILGTAGVTIIGSLTVNGPSFTVAGSNIIMGPVAGNPFLLSPGATFTSPSQLATLGSGGIELTGAVGFNVTPIGRIAGWGAPTGTATKTTFDTASVTLSVLAEHVKALIDNLTSYGLIGP